MYSFFFYEKMYSLKNFSHWAIQICQNQGSISSLLSGKIRLLNALFGLFLAGNRAGSQVKGSESKFDISYFTHTIPGQLPVKNFCSSTFQFYSYRSQRICQKNFNPDFKAPLLFLILRLCF